ncbi:MAG: hypothetical protein K8R69_08640 [Deltaproteobacteria bacterium]|nr:hypothetical protein [Deltaproteobacteria bacterium]
MKTKSPPGARALALQITREVLSGRGFASERLDALLSRHRLDERDRSLCTQLVYGVLREKAYLDQVVSRYVSAAKTPPGLRHLLRLAAYQCLSLEKIPDHALVNESVELAKGLFGVPPSRMVNAVLRKLIADRDSLLKARKIPEEGAFPDWMAKRWKANYSPAQVSGILDYFQAIPPVGLRVNLHRYSVDQVVDSLKVAGQEPERVSGTPILLLKHYDLQALGPLLENGSISIQDPHSYRVAEAVQARKGEKGLDACAGHGGKTAAIAESLGGSEGIWVHEPATNRLDELPRNFERLGLAAPRVLPSAKGAVRRDLSFDWILIDAPCSGTGTLGRKPEIRWRLQEKDLARLAEQQREILEEWLPFLKVGGRLVYAVCSLEHEEGRRVIESVLASHQNIIEIESRTWIPGPSPGDGFFVSRLRRVN